MIENVYRKEKANMSLNPPTALFKMPKNVRQIGRVDTKKKIYMEDYVMTFVRKLGEKNINDYQIAILLGEFITIEGTPNIFIRGAIEIGSVSLEDKMIFNNSIWNQIYEEIKQNFTNVEVVGWVATKAGMILEPDNTFEKIHINHFAGQDKVFLMYDSIEREEAFYIFEKNHLKKYAGYYIYYERNQEMQTYMLAHKKEEKVHTEEIDDRVLKEMRKRFAEKEEIKNKGNHSKNLVYTVGTVAAAVVLIWGVSKLNHYEQFQGVKDAIAGISGQNREEIVSEEENPTTSIETVGSNIKNIREENIIGDKLNPENNEKIEDDTEKIKDEKDNTSKNTSEGNNLNSNPPQSQGASEIKNQDTAKETNQNKAAKTYVVKKGDSLAAISMKLYQTLDYVDELQKLNHIKDKNKIVEGDKLILPK